MAALGGHLDFYGLSVPHFFLYAIDCTRMEGFQRIEDRKVARQLPEDWENLKILVQKGGGVGDVLITIGSIARKLKEKECYITAAVMEHQRRLIEKVQGVDDSVQCQHAEKHVLVENYDVYLNYVQLFNNAQYLLKDDYYHLVEKRTGFKLKPGRFNFQRSSARVNGREIVCLHTGASNPNRRWPEKKYEELAYAICEKFDVVVYWLGTRDEFGFNDENYHIYRLADISNDLVYQARQVAKSSYFVGNDSGFAHIAGMLEIPGSVIFSVTHPDDVIRRYPTLKGIHAFENYDAPSRSLRINDGKSARYLEAITVEQVLDSIDLPECAIDCTLPKKRTEGLRLKVGLLGEDVRLDSFYNFLSKYYDVKKIGAEERYSYAIILRLVDNICEVTTPKGAIRVSANNYENVRRALREIKVDG